MKPFVKHHNCTTTPKGKKSQLNGLSLTEVVPSMENNTVTNIYIFISEKILNFVLRGWSCKIQLLIATNRHVPDRMTRKQLKNDVSHFSFHHMREQQTIINHPKNII